MTRRVFVSEHGNVFMREIAEHLVEALQLSGNDATLVTDELPSLTGNPLDNLVVAPHEFFGLFPAAEADRQTAAARSVCINTEQPGTPFFDLAMQYARAGGVVLDINPFSLDAIRRAGRAAVHLPLGYVTSMDHWRATGSSPPSPSPATRSVDIGFLAGRTERREAFIGGAAGQLWEWRTDLRFFSWHRPARADHRTFASGEAKYRALADTRILLNVHRGDDPYFEWARVVEAMANGCVVASETSVGFEPLIPGVHFLMGDLDDLAEQAVALAFDEPRRAAMADEAHELLTTALHQRELIERSLAAATVLLADHRASGSRHRPWQRITAPERRATSVYRTTSAPFTPAITAERQMLDKTARDLKQAYLTQIRTVRSIERSLAIVRHGSADHLEVARTPAFDQVKPDVTVVIPLFNQGQFLGDAVHSVVAAAGGGGGGGGGGRGRSGGSPLAADIVIVDDHSTDDSLAVASTLLSELEWFPIELVSRAANGGLPVARNTGFGRARAPYVFALDADNVLYPSGLRLLAAHLDTAPPEVVAAYGVLERFDEHGSLGLTSHLPWDPDLLVHGAFIDAMAMFRAAEWTKLGGYADSTDIYGWEDYDLWLTTAERGLRSDLVPAAVGRYREQPGSMRRISDIDMASNFVTLRERHPRLPWPS